MSQDTLKYERLVALAGWLWTRLRDNQATFRRSDLIDVEGLSHFGEPSPAGRKSFERAKQDLATFGIDIEWEVTADVDDDPDNTGAYRIRGLSLSAEQQQALVGLAFSIAYRDLESGRKVKIPGAFLDGAGETLLLEANGFVAPVAEAIDERVCIEFVYKPGTPPREVQPIRLAFDRGYWYLSAFDLTKHEARTFRLDHVQSVERTETPWDDQNDTPDTREMASRANDRFFWGGGDRKNVVLAVDEEAELSAVRLMPGLDTVRLLGNGRIVMSRPFSNEENMLDAVLSLGSRVEVLEPPELRKAMIDHLDAMIGEAL